MLVLFVIPPLVVQLFNGAVSWIPTTLFSMFAWVSAEVSLGAALLALQRRDAM